MTQSAPNLPSPSSKQRFSPLKAALLYAVAAIAWILGSGWLVEQIVASPEQLALLELIKGVTFVVVTALLMFILLKSTRVRDLAEENPGEAKKSVRGLALALLGLGTLVPLLSLLVIGLQKPNIEAKINDHLHTLTSLRGAQIEQWLAERQGDAQSLQEDPVLRKTLQAWLSQRQTATPSSEASPAVLASELQQRFLSLVTHYQYKSVTLLDTQHQTLLNLGAHYPIHAELKTALQHAQTTLSITRSNLYFEANSAILSHLDWVVPVQVELADGKHTLLIVLHSGPSQFLWPLLDTPQNYNFESHSQLLHLKGNQVSRLFSSQAEPTSAHSRCKPQEFYQLIQAQQNTPRNKLSSLDCHGEQFYAALYPLEGIDWLLMHTVPKKQVLKEMYVLSGWIALITLFAVISISAALWLLWRQQQRLQQMRLHTTESRLNYFINASSTVLYVLDFTAETGQFGLKYVSNNIEWLFGFNDIDPQQVTTWWEAALHPEDRERATAEFAQVTHIQSDHLIHEYRIYDGSGQLRHIRDEMRLLRDEQGRPSEIIGTWNDITLEKQHQSLLLEAKVVFDSTREGIMVTDAQSRIINVNAAFSRITGYSFEEIQGKTPEMLHSGQHSAEFYQQIWDAIDTDGFWQGELYNKRKNGEIYPELISINRVLNEAGQVSHYIAVFSDISKLKATQDQIDYLAHFDPLTGLPNRAQLRLRLQQQIKQATRTHSSFALLVLDLDLFKDVNDSYGHAVGDEVLHTIAERLKQRLRERDTFARLGGDEFAIILEPLLHQQDAARLADEILQALSLPISLSNGQALRLGASIGICLHPQHGHTAEQLLQHADAALYRAKEEGRNRFAYYTQEMTLRARARIEFEEKLKRALNQGELQVYYQPQTDIRSGQVSGAEALLRWHSSDGQVISPLEFIPLAEETGLIRDIGEWVLKEVCRQGKAWQEQGLAPLRLAVNLSAMQFQQPELETQILRILQDTAFPPQWLELEITESALMQYHHTAQPLLLKLQKLGVSVAIDDFGTGYSSLAYLKRFSVDVLKIDKRFVDDIASDADDRTIINAIIAMGHSLGLKVLAEGVETELQLNYLTQQQCDYFQGYLESPPLPAKQFEQWLKARSNL